jgi:tRNA (guanosine-2'-O-)-methyltransferase
MPPSERRLQKFRQVLDRRQTDLTVVLENIHDPHNVSAILRSCDAVGIMGIVLLYTVEPFPRIGRKSSSSASKWLDRRKFTSVDECYATLRGEGLRVLATHLGAAALPLYDLDLTGPSALVFGNEHRGVSDEAASKADGNFLIPMAGMIQSLNVSVAAAVSLYEAFRQRQAAGHYDRSSLPGEMREKLLLDWIRR